MDINLDVQARRVTEGQDVFEVTLQVRAEAHDPNAQPGESRVFLAELAYAGVFTLNGLPAETVEPVLLVGVPDLLAVMAGLSPTHWALGAAIGAVGTFGHLLLLTAHGQAPASRLAPFTYAQIGWALALSWLAFDTWPDAVAIAGIVVITVCGALNAWMNVRAGPPQKVAVAPLD